MGRIIIHPRKKQKVFEKDNFKCVICGASGDFNCLEADHIIPVVDGGTNEYSNLQTLCYKCNMKKRFGSKSENILVCISPSIGPEKAEFINYKEEFPEKFEKFQVRPNYFDLSQIGEEELISSGILENHIEIMRICTFSNPVDFFSYRRDKICGRHVTVCAVKERLNNKFIL